MAVSRAALNVGGGTGRARGCQLVELLGLATSTVSKHASLLHQARLIESRKEGRWAFFRLADGEAPSAVQETLVAMLNALDRDPQGKADRQRL